MSSPGQIAEPRERPHSGLPASFAAPRSPPSQHTFKEFGQDYQFTETWANPPPEMVVDSAEPGAAADPSQADGAHETILPDGDSRDSNTKEAAVWIPPPEKPWYRRIPNMWWIVGGIIFVGTASVILAILGAMNLLGPHTSVSQLPTPSSSSTRALTALTTSSSLDASPSTTSSASSSSSSTGFVTSTTSNHPIPTAIITDCSDTASFYNDIEWVGVDTTYSTTYDQADSAQECCNKCFGGGPGCAGWLYNGTSPFTPCTKIMINTNHPLGDGKCPNGYASKTSMSKGGDGVAGMGPCSKDISVG